MGNNNILFSLSSRFSIDENFAKTTTPMVIRFHLFSLALGKHRTTIIIVDEDLHNGGCVITGAAQPSLCSGQLIDKRHCPPTSGACESRRKAQDDRLGQRECVGRRSSNICTTPRCSLLGATISPARYAVHKGHSSRHLHRNRWLFPGPNKSQSFIVRLLMAAAKLQSFRTR